MRDLDRLPRDEGGPVFAEPWEAQAFGMTLALYERGAFTWTEWAERLSVEIGAVRAHDDGSRYYELWLAALEKPAGGAKKPATPKAPTKTPSDADSTAPAWK